MTLSRKELEARILELERLVAELQNEMRPATFTYVYPPAAGSAANPPVITYTISGGGPDAHDIGGEG